MSGSFSRSCSTWQASEIDMTDSSLANRTNPHSALDLFEDLIQLGDNCRYTFLVVRLESAIIMES